jgi:hypothetical protein
MDGVTDSKETVNNAVIQALWGVEEIAPIIRRTPRQTYHMLAAGHIKSARRIGGRWFANRDALLKEFGGA